MDEAEKGRLAQKMVLSGVADAQGVGAEEFGREGFHEGPTPSALEVDGVAFSFFAVITVFLLLATGALSVYVHYSQPQRASGGQESTGPSTQPQ